MLRILQQPYPHEPPSIKKVWTALGIAGFVFLFLYIFAPFGIGQMKGNFLLQVMGYGIVTFLAIVLLDLVLPTIWPRPFKESTWTVGKEIVYFMANLGLIALGNMLYTAFMGYTSISLLSFLMFFMVTVLVGVFPSAAMIMMAYTRKLKRAINAAQAMNQELGLAHPSQSQILLLEGENHQDRITCESNDLLAITSADNYLEVWLDLRGEWKRQIMRGSLSQMESYLADKGHFLRVHRSHLVNMDQVKAVQGNAQGYQLQLHMEAPWLAVSRRQSKVLRDEIHMLV